jgi:CRISPR type III-A-associated protein Csm2
MTWKQDFESARQDARTLSDIGDFNTLVDLASRVGQELKQGNVSSRQIRVLLSETTAGVSRIRRGRTLGNPGLPERAAEDPAAERDRQDRAAQREAALLNISLVYNAGREKNGAESIRQLTELVGSMGRHVQTFEDYKVLRKFSEAIMAYFKFHGGK